MRLGSITGVASSNAQTSHLVVEVIRRGHHELQMLSSFFPFRCFFVLKNVLHKWALIWLKGPVPDERDT